MKKILMPLAPGFEEIEALAVVNILRRAGAEVVTAGTEDGPIEGRTSIRVLPDSTLDDALGDEYDAIVLPGGAGGTERLKKDARVTEVLRRLDADDKILAAICAAPTVLSAAGVTKGRLITSHPGVRAELTGRGERLLDERVVVDGRLVTSQGPGTALEFAFYRVSMLFGEDKVREINRGVLARL
jgi:4-methyl-5(b-hydroxyethyl)-thiazole monophosphate biosynthesis